MKTQKRIVIMLTTNEYDTLKDAAMKEYRTVPAEIRMYLNMKIQELRNGSTKPKQSRIKPTPEPVKVVPLETPIITEPQPPFRGVPASAFTPEEEEMMLQSEQEDGLPVI